MDSEPTPIEKAHATAVQLRGKLGALAERKDMTADDYKAILGNLAQAMDGHCDELKKLADAERIKQASSPTGQGDGIGEK